MIGVRHIETHIAHACNLNCESCSHFSDQGHGGRHTPESFLAEVGPWARRLRPQWFLMLGGEPTLNPQLEEIVPLARRLWPDRNVKCVLVTNGFLLHRFPNLPKLMAEHGVRLDLSIHHESAEYMEKLAPVMALIGTWKGMGVEVHIRASWQEWMRYIKGKGKDTKPWQDSDSQASWNACGSRWCLNIHEGKLWKCPPLAYLPMQAKKYGFENDPVWQRYLSYRPLEPTCNERELGAFVAKEMEGYCAMCPASPERFSKPLPLRK